MNRKYTSALLAVMLLLGIFVVATAATEEPIVTAPIVPNSPETEPNDTFGTANLVGWGAKRAGTINPAGDVDFFYFYASALDSVAIEWGNPASGLDGVLSLYSSDGVLLAESACTDDGVCLQYVFPYPYDYYPFYLKVTDANGAGGPDYAYRLKLNYLGMTDPNEPNNSIGEATPIAYDEGISGALTPCGDEDYFTFEGQAGDEVEINTYNASDVQLLDADQNIVYDNSDGAWPQWTTLPTDGVYFLRIYDSDGLYCEFRYQFRLEFLDQPIYLSLDKGGRIEGITFTSGDILRYWTHTGKWEKFLDLSDVGLNGNLTVLGSWGNYYAGPRFALGFSGQYVLPGNGVVMPQDLVDFVATATGEDTAGEVKLLFDGSAVGLTTKGERLDAATGMAGLPDLAAFLSTTGRAKVPESPYGAPGLTVEDEDLVEFYGVDLRPTYGRTWEPFFDGSAYGLGAVDVIGADYSWDWDRYAGTYVRVIWLSFDRAVTFGGIIFAPGDIAQCFDNSEDGGAFQCDSVSKFFDASDAGLSGLKIDAFEVGPKE